MDKPDSIRNFDFHNHPFNKGAISKRQLENLSWDSIKVDMDWDGPWFCPRLVIEDEYFIEGEEVLEKEVQSEGFSPGGNLRLMLEQIFNSQCSLSDLETSGTLSITGLIAMEQAYAETAFIRCALPWITPIDTKLIKKIIKKKISYNDLFIRELTQIENTQRKKPFNILSSLDELKEKEMNVVLCIEGAHNLQTEIGNPKSIIPALKELKSNPKYKFLYLTLTHLTRQKAAVHSFGTYIRVGEVNMTPNFKYTPDPLAEGISELGLDIIKIAYDPQPYSMLIDIKHMSYRSRQMFFELHTKHYKNIPVVATHMGMTGCSWEEARIIEIIPGRVDEKGRQYCDEVLWKPVLNKVTNTEFNPWTINLYDNEILLILESGGLIGLNLDQRILGVGEFPHESMSPREVKTLNLKPNLMGFVSGGDDECIDPAPGWDPDTFISNDLMFHFTRQEKQAEIRKMRCRNQRHIDYLANNIMHIMKVGFRGGYNGSLGKMNVCHAICIGSDLDGLTDPINFPKEKFGNNFDPNNYVTASEYQQLREELYHSLDYWLPRDKDFDDFRDYIPDVCTLVDLVFAQNGWDFLVKNFSNPEAKKTSPIKSTVPSPDSPLISP